MTDFRANLWAQISIQKFPPAQIVGNQLFFLKLGQDVITDAWNDETNKPGIIKDYFQRLVKRSNPGEEAA